jgi:hypothetical protein
MNIKQMKVMSPEELRAKRKMYVAIEDALRSGLTMEQTAEYTGASLKYVVQIDWKMKNPKKWQAYNEQQNALKAAQRKARRTAELRKKRKEERKVVKAAPLAAPTVHTQVDMFPPMAEPFYFDIEKYRAAIEPTTYGATIAPIAPPVDAVNNPPHYTVGGISVFDFIEAKGLNYGRGNVIKYVTRAGVKDSATELQDLEKAAWYLAAEIDRLKGKK